MHCINSDTLSLMIVSWPLMFAVWTTARSHWNHNCSTDTSKNTTGHILIWNFRVVFVFFSSKKADAAAWDVARSEALLESFHP